MCVDNTKADVNNSEFSVERARMLALDNTLNYTKKFTIGGLKQIEPLDKNYI